MGYIQHRVPCCRAQYEEKLKNKIRRNTSILMEYEIDGDMILLDFTYPNYNGGPWDFIVNGVNIFDLPGMGTDGLYFTDGKSQQNPIFSTDYKTGINIIQLVYPGDQEHPAEEAYFKFNLLRQDAEISVNENISATAGDNIAISVIGPDDIYGDVTLTIDNVEYTGTFEDGSAVINIDGLSRGTYTGYISYLGDPKYNPYNTSININVEGIDPDIECTKTADGESIIIDIRGPRGISGNVTLSINGVDYTGTFVDNRTLIIVEGLDTETYTVDVSYPGDNIYNSYNTSFDLNE